MTEKLVGGWSVSPWESTVLHICIHIYMYTYIYIHIYVIYIYIYNIFMYLYIWKVKTFHGVQGWGFRVRGSGLRVYRGMIRKQHGAYLINDHGLVL